MIRRAARGALQGWVWVGSVVLAWLYLAAVIERLDRIEVAVQQLQERCPEWGEEG